MIPFVLNYSETHRTFYLEGKAWLTKYVYELILLQIGPQSVEKYKYN